MSEDCLFCGIVAGEIPSEKVAESERSVAFRDINPPAPVHVLVVPRRHLRDVRDLAEDPMLLAEVTRTAGEIAAELTDGDFRLVFNTGASAGQSVFHVHAHVLAGTSQGESTTGEL